MNYLCLYPYCLFFIGLLALVYWLSCHTKVVATAIYTTIIGAMFTAIALLLQFALIVPVREHGQPIGLLHGVFSLLQLFTGASCPVLSMKPSKNAASYFCWLAC